MPSSRKSSLGSFEEQHDINMSEETVHLGRYIWQRIHQCGVGRIFGVPGDFNLALLDYIYDVQGMEWVGSTNELNAAYASDGYARTKGVGCVVTTHGVGELSALNGIAGSMTEQIKVIHVVGQSSRKMQQDRTMIHHNIGSKPDHQVFNKAAANFRTAAASLFSDNTAADEVDEALRECFVNSKPVYINVPMDMVTLPVLASRLNQPLDLEPTKDTGSIESATHAVLEAVYSSKRPALLVDSLVRRHDAGRELDELLDVLHIPVFTTILGKGTVDEDHPCFIGTYNGSACADSIRTAFEACDTVVVLGDMPTDSNSGGFTRKLDERSTVYINTEDVVVPGIGTFNQTPIRAVLACLTAEVDSTKVLGIDIPSMSQNINALDNCSQQITQAWIWPRLARFFQQEDVVVCETGTASFGLPHSTLPGRTDWITQAYYGSIGYATPAAFGVEVALKELASLGHRSRGRTVLVTGDGSLTLTLQEVGNMIKHGAAPVVFIINNAGYTIERAIHGAHQSYNDIILFDYSHMLQFFGMPIDQAASSFHRATSRHELDLIMQKDCVISPTRVQIVEVVMDKLDIPWNLTSQLMARGPDVVREMRDSGFVVDPPVL